MDIKKLLGQKIKKIRVKNGMTQEQLAEIVDISQCTLNGIEIDENFLTAQTLEKIMECLNVTPDVFFKDDKIKSVKELEKEILNEIKILKKRPETLYTLYKIIKALK